MGFDQQGYYDYILQKARPVVFYPTEKPVSTRQYRATLPGDSDLLITEVTVRDWLALSLCLCVLFRWSDELLRLPNSPRDAHT